jgi:hypothetical protein
MKSAISVVDQEKKSPYLVLALISATDLDHALMLIEAPDLDPTCSNL